MTFPFSGHSFGKLWQALGLVWLVVSWTANSRVPSSVHTGIRRGRLARRATASRRRLAPAGGRIAARGRHIPCSLVVGRRWSPRVTLAHAATGRGAAVPRRAFQAVVRTGCGVAVAQATIGLVHGIPIPTSAIPKGGWCRMQVATT